MKKAIGMAIKAQIKVTDIATIKVLIVTLK
jgi:hypothetical protein